MHNLPIKKGKTWVWPQVRSVELVGKKKKSATHSQFINEDCVSRLHIR